MLRASLSSALNRRARVLTSPCGASRLNAPSRAVQQQLSVWKATSSGGGSRFTTAPSSLRLLSLSHSFSTVSSPSDKPASNDGSSQVPAKPTGGLFQRLFGRESCEASPSFKNRWLMAIPCFATHMCIGSPWAWSIMGDIITRENGFVASTGMDWTLMQSALPLSIVFVFLGGSAAVLGPWQSRVGHRKSILYAAMSFGGGLAIGSLGIHLHMLPLLYLGYGALAGTGLGLAYTPCISTLMHWFPDRKGTASGITIAGFGSGALLFTPLVQKLTKHFSKLPEYLGPAKDFAINVVDGNMFVDINGKAVQVVEAMAADVAKLSVSVPEGLYVVGSGSTGAAETLAVLAAGYFSVMFASSLALKTPHSSFVPPVAPSLKPSGDAAVAPAAVPAKVVDVSMEEAIRSPQFHLLGVMFTSIAMGGMGIFSVAKPMMSEVFSGSLPTVVTSSFAATYLLCLSLANLGGRLGWAAISDKVGRRNMFHMFTLSCIPLYLSVPYFVEQAVTQSDVLPLYAFIGATVGTISIMGGTYAILPAYEADLFGAKNVGPTHGVMMIYSAAAALLGPQLLIRLRLMAESSAINDLLTKVSPDDFTKTFGAPVAQAQQLLESKTLTLSKLLTIAPPGTIDPTPHLYDNTMYSLAGLMVVAAIAHSRVVPYVAKQQSSRTTIDVQAAEKVKTQ